MKSLRFSFVALALLCVSAPAVVRASDPQSLAERTFTITAKTDRNALVAQFFNEEGSRKGSPLYREIESLRMANEGYELILPVSATQDVFFTDSGYTGGQYNTMYLVGVRAGYKSNISRLAYFYVDSTQLEGDETHLDVRLHSQVQVDIKYPN